MSWWIVLEGDKCVDKSKGDSEPPQRLPPRCHVLEFASFADRERDPRVDECNQRRIAFDRLNEAEAEKTEDEYRGKREESALWLSAHPVEDNTPIPTDGTFPYLTIEAEECGCTMFEVATSVDVAVERDNADPIQRARKRIAKREAARAWLKSMEQ